jgi:hypothetical protein
VEDHDARDEALLRDVIRSGERLRCAASLVLAIAFSLALVWTLAASL